jgi:hypothetical protein
MKDTIIVLICTLPSIALAVGAILTALSGVGGWGWFLFAAILTNPAVLGLKIQ